MAQIWAFVTWCRSPGCSTLTARTQRSCECLYHVEWYRPSLKFLLFSLFSRNYLLNQPLVTLFEPVCDEGDAPLQGWFCIQQNKENGFSLVVLWTVVLSLSRLMFSLLKIFGLREKSDLCCRTISLLYRSFFLMVATFPRLNHPDQDDWNSTQQRLVTTSNLVPKLSSSSHPHYLVSHYV